MSWTNVTSLQGHSEYRWRKVLADDAASLQLEDAVLKINRCCKVVKGGKRFSFSALVVQGSRAGIVGYGYGKAKEVPLAVEKGMALARKNLIRVPLRGNTLPHRVSGVYGASRVVLLPAAPGTGVIAGLTVKTVLDLTGVKDVLTKSFGSNNPINLVKAVFDGLLHLRSREEVEALREVSLG